MNSSPKIKVLQIYPLHVLLYIFFSAFHSHAQTSAVNIGILNNLKSTTMILTPLVGDYDIFGDGNKIFKLKNKDLAQLILQDSLIKIKTLSSELGSFHRLELIAHKKNGSFQVKSAACLSLL